MCMSIRSLFPFGSWSKYGFRNYSLSKRSDWDREGRSVEKGRYLLKERSLRVSRLSVAGFCWMPGKVGTSIRSDRAPPVGLTALGTDPSPHLFWPPFFHQAGALLF